MRHCVCLPREIGRDARKIRPTYAAGGPDPTARDAVPVEANGATGRKQRAAAGGVIVSMVDMRAVDVIVAPAISAFIPAVRHHSRRCRRHRGCCDSRNMGASYLICHDAIS
jgi:hypothetical protein